MVMDESARVPAREHAAAACAAHDCVCTTRRPVKRRVRGHDAAAIRDDLWCAGNDKPGGGMGK